ncbi:hypothetical protein ABT332_02530 [Saccharomonospora azurea]|uniref:hypothetical protein n=2 Tax=Saccharomonospora azurea TaxID=40988 RepID=UPI003320DA12
MREEARTVGEGEASDVADVIDERPAFQRREWRVNRVAWVGLVLILLAGLAGLWGGGALGQARVTGADGRLQVDYDRFVRNLGESTLQVRFPPGSAHEGSIRLSLSQDYLADNEVMATTPDPMSVTAEGDRLVYEFGVRGDGPLTVTFDLRPNSGLGVLEATVGGTSAKPVRIRQLVYP